MARVASCPQCDHQLVIPSEATGEAWAKCPECRAFFQIGEAMSRELPTAVLVEAEEKELAAHAPETDEIGLEPETEISIDETVVSYLLSRMPRELAAARSLVAEIDRRALEERAEVTRNFVARVLGDITPSGFADEEG